MEKENPIPEVELTKIHQKDFGFQIVNNREILLNPMLNHDPFIPHRIRYYAILFILEGEGVHYIDFKKYAYKTGSIIFISKEQVHAFEKNLDRKAFFLLFTEEFLSKGGGRSNLMQELSLYNYHLYPPVIELNEEQLEIFSNITHRLKYEFDTNNDFFSEEIMLSALKIFLCLAERIRKQDRDLRPHSKYHEDYIRFQNLLNEHILESRKVRFYANHLNLSSKTLNRITQAMLGKSAKDYINEFLIIEMKRLLMNTSYSVKEIAYKTGFEETTNFVKFFKKNAGLSPMAFRRQF